MLSIWKVLLALSPATCIVLHCISEGQFLNSGNYLYRNAIRKRS